MITREEYNMDKIEHYKLQKQKQCAVRLSGTERVGQTLGARSVKKTLL
jgi:hypothetical protein